MDANIVPPLPEFAVDIVLLKPVIATSSLCAMASYLQMRIGSMKGELERLEAGRNNEHPAGPLIQTTFDSFPRDAVITKHQHLIAHYEPDVRILCTVLHDVLNPTVL